MAELIYHIATTVDSFISDKDGNAGPSVFLYEGDHVTGFLEDVSRYDAVLMGGKTYEYGFQFGLKPGEPSAFKDLKHYIFSSSMQFESNEKVELIKDNAVEYIRNLKNKEKGKLWLCGGSMLAGSLIQENLIDQIILKVNPVIIGEGKPLLDGVNSNLILDLIDIKHFDNGVIKPTYNVIYS
ncbi:dihydrofolate reductase family protein [Fictibacillus halophilus]|uniref:dihydrofolate reductase family protein n=1 Tax=Fictibacillus halophilus TaxID=1610490 RepID=UPI00362F1120